MKSCTASLFGCVARGAVLIGVLSAGPAATLAQPQTEASTPVAPTAMPTAPLTPPAQGAGSGVKVNSLLAGVSAATCEKNIAVLTGKNTDQALLKSADVQALASAVPDLPTCGAIAADSDALCKILPTGEAGGKKKDDPRQSCRKTWAQFHELRKETGKPFVTEVQLEDCRASKDSKPYCDAIAEAFRTGDPDKCPHGPVELMCKAGVTLDPSFCRGPGTTTDDEVKRCREDLDKTRALTKGLKVMAESGQPLDRQFAAAALGKPDACAPLAAEAMSACTNGTAKAPAKAPAKP